MITTWDQFNEQQSFDDVDTVMNYIAMNLSSKEIKSLRNELSNISEAFNPIDRLTKWFDNKMMTILSKKKSKFYTDISSKLELFDLSSLDDVKKEFRDFRLNSIYLAGGMDKSSDVGAGWRSEIEYMFEFYHPTRSKVDEEIDIDYKGDHKVKPCYVIDGEHLTKYVKYGNSYSKKYYTSPAILNPVRKEVDRTKNTEFKKQNDDFKANKFQDSMNKNDFSGIRKVYSQKIEIDD